VTPAHQQQLLLDNGRAERRSGAFCAFLKLGDLFQFRGGDFLAHDYLLGMGWGLPPPRCGELTKPIMPSYTRIRQSCPLLAATKKYGCAVNYLLFRGHRFSSPAVS